MQTRAALKPQRPGGLHLPSAEIKGGVSRPVPSAGSPLLREHTARAKDKHHLNADFRGGTQSYRPSHLSNPTLRVMEVQGGARHPNNSPGEGAGGRPPSAGPSEGLSLD